MAAAQPGGSVFFLLGEGGADTTTHQVVRTASDHLYIFTGKQGTTTIRAYRTIGPGLPSSAAAFAAPVLLTAPSLPISLDAAYDGGSLVHVLINTQAGQILDYPFDVTSNTFGAPLTLATNGGTVPTAGSTGYIGTVGVTGMVDKSGTLHVAYWSTAYQILHRAFSYNSTTKTLTPLNDWTRVDTSGSATHPVLAVSPLDNSMTVAWVSEADSPPRIRTRTKANNGAWGAVESVSTTPAWVCTDTLANCNGVNIDQGPSLVIDSAGVKHLVYIEAFDYAVLGDYGRIHYAKNSGSGWSDQALNALSHAPTIAVDGANALYIIGHGHPKNPSCKSVDELCLITQASNGTWNAPQLLAQPPPGLSLDNMNSVKWSLVGFNRPEAVEFVAYATPYSDTTLYYGRVSGSGAPQPPPPVLTSLMTPALLVGGSNSVSGSGFSGGSVVKLFVATASGAAVFGPYTPSSQTATELTWAIPSNVSMGNGFGSVQVVNTDQSYAESNVLGALLEGDALDNIPTILYLNGEALEPADPTVGVAHIDTVLAKGAAVTITGTGFNTPGVNLFTATGNMGPLWPAPGGSPTQIQVTVPVGAPTGPANFQVVNSPYTGNVASNAVSAVIGARPTITGVSVVGTTVTVTGTGFCTLSVINLFNLQGTTVVNLGGLNGTTPKIPLTVNETQLTFTVPAGTVAGPAFVEVLNPPYIPFSSSGNDPDGAFEIP